MLWHCCQTWFPQLAFVISKVVDDYLPKIPTDLCKNLTSPKQTFPPSVLEAQTVFPRRKCCVRNTVQTTHSGKVTIASPSLQVCSLSFLLSLLSGESSRHNTTGLLTDIPPISVNKTKSVLKEHFQAEERLEWALSEMRGGLWCYTNIQGSSQGKRRSLNLRWRNFDLTSTCNFGINSRAPSSSSCCLHKYI